jgi:hypothetical protein
MKYTLVNSDGKVSYRERMSLKQMQKFVGGYIELVSIEGVKFLCNEDGLQLKLPKNKRYPVFVGNVLILEGK